MNRQLFYISFILVLVGISFGVKPSLAAKGEQVAQVVAVRGEVVAENQAGQLRNLAMKSPIYRQDTIKTGKFGRIQILFKDTSIISLARKTEMKIAEYQWDAAKKSGAMNTKVKEGTFRVMGGAITKFSPKHFTTETPSATIGVRGSMYAGVVSANTLSVVFQGGKGIDIMNAAGTVAITKPGFGTRVLALNKPPLPPKKFSAADMESINNALTGKVEPEEQMQNKKQKGGEAEAKNGEAPKKEEVAQKGKSKAAEQGTGKQQATDEGGSAGEASGTESTASTQESTSTGAEGATTTSTGTESTASTQTGETTGTVSTAPALETATTLSTDETALSSPDLTTTTTISSTTTTTTTTTDTVSTTNLYDPSTDPNNTPDTVAAATPLPTDGITHYVGGFNATESVSGRTVAGDIFFGINWHAHKVFGIMTDQPQTTSTTSGPQGGQQGGPPAFFFGTVGSTSKDGTTPVKVRILGTDGGDDPGTTGSYDPNNPPPIIISSMDGKGTGTISGPQYNIFNLSAGVTDYSLSQPGNITQGQWDAAATAQIDPKSAADPISTKGVSDWNGFAVGISENVNAIDVERKLFMNNSPDFPNFITDSDGLSLNVDRDNGTISGKLKLTQVDRLNNGGISVDIGGANDSAYVLDHAFGAVIGCSDPSGKCVNDDSGSATPNAALNQHGNYLVTENPANQFSPYATWGYWEISHQEDDGSDPDTGPDMYHTHMPYSMWIAGERTPPDYINGLIANSTFVGQYSGMARGFEVDKPFNDPNNPNNNSFGGVRELTNGHMDLAVDFGNASGPSAITGSLAFDQVTLNIDSDTAALNPGKFTAKITNPDITSSVVNGAFYGPKVNSVGGNFEATSSTAQYIGIFGGNLKNGPAP